MTNSTCGEGEETDEAFLRRLQALGLFEPVPDQLASPGIWQETELMEVIEDMATRGEWGACGFLWALDQNRTRMVDLHRTAMDLAGRFGVRWTGSEHAPPDRPNPIEAVINALARKGLIEFAFEFRNGEPVWRLSELGNALTKLEAEGDVAALEYKRLSENGDDPRVRDEILRRGMSLARRLGVLWRGAQPSDVGI